jgi:hypothetical protein
MATAQQEGDLLAVARARVAPLLEYVNAINTSAHRPLKQRQHAWRGLEAARASLPADSFIIVDFLLQVVTTWQLPERFEDNFVNGQASFAAEEVAWVEDKEHTLERSREAAALLAARHAAGAFYDASAEESAWTALGEASLGGSGGGAQLALSSLTHMLQRWPDALRRGAEGRRLLALAVRVMAEVEARGHVARCSVTGVAWPPRRGYSNNVDVLTMRLQAIPDVAALTRAACDAAAMRSLRERAARFAGGAGGPMAALDTLGLAGAVHRAALAADFGRLAERAGEDREKHGIRRCALPSCGAAEPHAQAFKVCSRCRAACYCCAEHQREDWKRHKRDAGGCAAAAASS